MSTYKFNESRMNADNIEEFLLETLGVDRLIPSNNHDELVFFHNGDKMTVNTQTGMMVWEPLRPGEMFTSRLSMRLHQWFGKGIISPYKITQTTI